MDCPKCGTFADENTQVCMNCGSSFEEATSSPEQPQDSEQTQQDLDSSPQSKDDKPKIKHVALWIILAVSLTINLLVLIFFSSLIVLKPKDLGVKYTQADYKSAMEKIGIRINLDKMTSKEQKEFQDKLNRGKLNIEKYKWEFGNFKNKEITLTSSEATALLNELSPSFYPVDNVQLNVLSDGVIEASCKTDTSFLDTAFRTNIFKQIPLNKVNVYFKGTSDITNNKLEIDPEDVDAGVFPVQEKYLSEKNVNVIEKSFDNIIKKTKKLEINSLKSDSEGNMVFDGVIPQSVILIPIKK